MKFPVQEESLHASVCMFLRVNVLCGIIALLYVAKDVQYLSCESVLCRRSLYMRRCAVQVCVRAELKVMKASIPHAQVSLISRVALPVPMC